MHKHLTGDCQQISIYQGDADNRHSFGLGRENRKKPLRIAYFQPQKVMFNYAY
jgi:hypothetical protein